jgi:hypothetical protein
LVEKGRYVFLSRPVCSDNLPFEIRESFPLHEESEAVSIVASHDGQRQVSEREWWGLGPSCQQAFIKVRSEPGPGVGCLGGRMRGYQNPHVSPRVDSALVAPLSAPSLNNNKRGIEWPDTMDRPVMVEAVAVQTNLIVFNVDPGGAPTFAGVLARPHGDSGDNSGRK